MCFLFCFFAFFLGGGRVFLVDGSFCVCVCVFWSILLQRVSRMTWGFGFGTRTAAGKERMVLGSSVFWRLWVECGCFENMLSMKLIRSGFVYERFPRSRKDICFVLLLYNF